MYEFTKYEKAFNDIREVVGGWITDTLYDKEATSDEIKTALVYLVSMIETYDTALTQWKQAREKER